MAEYTDKDRQGMVDKFIKEARGGNPGGSPEDSFINGAVKDESKGFIPSVDDNDARFLQNSINMYNQVLSKKKGSVSRDPLLVDGVIGPKSKAAFKDAYATIPPGMRKALGKKINQG